MIVNVIGGISLFGFMSCIALHIWTDNPDIDIVRNLLSTSAYFLIAAAICFK